ncbi:hypothetical protein OHA70_07500 [Kribbella sp. NBC_00382]|uniref:hypothetical protein n=1 Tax=Kribbella sp. NBC_00382 TaxID=2975967 RepID=UPI002E1C4304
MIVLRGLRAGLLALSGAVVTLAQLNLPKDFWAKYTEVQWASVVILALLIGLDTVHEFNYFIRVRQIQGYEQDLRAVLSAAISGIVTATGVPWDGVAVRYYRLRGPAYRRRLVPVTAVMAGADLEEARREIRKGAGLVGVAFREQEILAEEWNEFVRVATLQGRKAWEQRSEDARFGLSWGEVRSSLRADGMVASPTFASANGKPDGCILVSGILNLAELKSDETRRVLDDLATVLDRLGPPPPGWWSAYERR